MTLSQIKVIRVDRRLNFSVFRFLSEKIINSPTRNAKGGSGSTDRSERTPEETQQQQQQYQLLKNTQESDAERELKSRAVMLARTRRHLVEVAVAALVSKIRDEELAVAKQCQEVMRRRHAGELIESDPVTEKTKRIQTSADAVLKELDAVVKTQKKKNIKQKTKRFLEDITSATTVAEKDSYETYRNLIRWQ